MVEHHALGVAGGSRSINDRDQVVLGDAPDLLVKMIKVGIA